MNIYRVQAQIYSLIYFLYINKVLKQIQKLKKQFVDELRPCQL